MTTDETVLSAVLRGDPTPWPHADYPAQAFLDAAGQHGIQPLIARQIRRGILLNAPDSVEQSLARAAVQHAAVEQCLADEVRGVLQALVAAGVSVVLIKGTALAYTHYPHPCLRFRTDTDLILRRTDLATAEGVFKARAYEPLNATRGDLVLNQQSYAKTDRLGVRHVLDVHWKVAGPQSVSDLLCWEELDRDAVPIPSLGEHARAHGDAHALLMACVHRMAHHYDNRRLVWLYDIHLLASRLDMGSLRALLDLADQKGVAGMCVHGLALARERFGTRLPEYLGENPARRPDDSAARFDRDVRLLDILASDLKALPGWRQRLRLLRQHVFPPAEYIRRRYGMRSSLALPILYGHRFVTGALKWRRPARGTDPFA